MAGKSPELVSLSPADVCALIGLDASDARYFASAAIRVRSAWVADWASRTGPQELSAAEAAMLVGVSRETVGSWVRRGVPPVLRARRAGTSAYRIAPAELARFLRELNGDASPPPVAETPGRERRRAARARELAAAACRGD